MENGKRRWGISSFTLHIIAMALMLCDHMWATVVPGNMWLTNIGRIAFPIFAFMSAEGYAHTKSFGRYMKRLLLWAVISEIPFNLMYGGSVFYPYHQNVLWTFLIALSCIWLKDQAAKKGKRWLTILAGILTCLAGAVLGLLLQVDYYAFGVLTVLMFHYFRGSKWWNYLLQAAGLYYINVVLFRGMAIDVTLLGKTFEIQQQGLSLFAMIPIMLYNGSLGPHSKAVRTGFYAFYPLHMLVLSVISLYLL